MKRLLEDLRPALITRRDLYARQRLLALGFPESIIPAQLDAARNLIRWQRHAPRRRVRSRETVAHPV